MTLPGSLRGILLDIEGTTTPIHFVSDVLFPFARKRLEAAVARAPEEPGLAEAVEQLRREWQAERETGVAGLPDFGDGAPYAHYLMDLDRKSTGLKQLQGLIWREGYASGELRSQVFDDVPEALAGWRAAGLRLAIFSSGSVLAQQLLFGHTEQGDLREHFEACFDTTTGPKHEAESYRRIAGALDLPPARLLFLSDVPGELDAARAAGLPTGLLRRPGNAPCETGEHPVYASFRELAAER